MRFRFRLVFIALLAVAGFAALVGISTIKRGPHAIALALPVAVADVSDSTELFVESEVVEAPFTMAGFTWEGEAPETVWYRVGDADGWTEWAELPMEAGDGPDPGTAEYERHRSGTDAVYVGEKNRIQFRFTGAAPRDGQAALIDTTTRTQPIVEQVLDQIVAAAADSAPAQPNIRPRADWDPTNLCPPRQTPEEIQVMMAVVHHTGIERAYRESEVPSILLGYCLYHRNSRGYDDVAYNLFVDRFGTAWEGRAGGVDKGIRGGHTAGFSSYSTGIALIGNYMSAYPTTAQRATLENLLAWKLGVHNLDPEGTTTVVSKGSYKYDEGVTITVPVINGHRDLQNTACPGTNLYAMLPSIRSRVGSVWSPPPSDYYADPTVGNFTGNGAPDGAVYRSSDGTWSVTDGSTGATVVWQDGPDGARFDFAVAADLDGDGRDSILTRSAATLSELRAGTASFSESSIGTLSASAGWLAPAAGNLTGSGGEAVAYVNSSGTVDVATSSGVGNWGNLGSGSAFAVVGDFSGDGTDDVAGFSAGGRAVVAVSTGGALGTASTWADVAPDSGWQYVVSGDFDGDGIDDIAAFHKSSQTWHLLRSTGSSFTLGTSITTPSTDSWSEAFDFDHDSDGVDEVVALDAYTGSWFLGRFNGVSPFFTELEDSPFRTTVVQPSSDGSGSSFLSWFGQESNWIRTGLGYGVGGEADATQRVFAASKYSTSAAVSRTAFASADVVYVATGDKYPDALAGGAAAVRNGAPVLLTSRDALDGAVADEIRRLGPSQIVILGGTAVISEAVGTQLAALAPEGAVRYGGADRYETAALISKASFESGADTVYIATGLNFPDALAGVPAAGTAGAPILLVREHVPAATAAELQRLAPSKIVILGGPVAVSNTVKAELEKYTSGSVTRLDGHDRYSTAAAVSANAFPGGADTVFVAIGTNFPDAVAAGPAAYELGGPLLLVHPDAAPGSTLDELRRLRASRIVIIGSESVVAPAVTKAMEGIGEGALTTRLAALPRP